LTVSRVSSAKAGDRINPAAINTRSDDYAGVIAELARTIREYADSEGLDFYETIFEILNYDQMNQVAAYGGFPQRYPHWRFGMEYERLSKTHRYGLGKIYEMVINNDPCYAYLLNDNEIVDQKTVIAHVYAHCDFFKNNRWFSATNRKMMDEMANHATKVRRHIERQGGEAVERWIEVCLSLESLIDPHSMFLVRSDRDARRSGESAISVEDEIARLPSKQYLDRWINPPEVIEKQRERITRQREEDKGKLPAEPQRGVLTFLLEHAPIEDWQADILALVRDEAYYYAPQGMTKIMNEGWATYWHSRIMTKHCLRDDELITYADHHAGTLASRPGNLNPYKVGVELFRDIEERWDQGKFGREYEECDSVERRREWDTELKKGREKIFEVRRIYNDVTFIDEFLTPEFVDKHQLYHYRFDPMTGQMRVVSRDYKKIKEQLLFSLTNHGQPYIYVVDGNYANRGELYLAHQHNGVDLDIRFAAETLKNAQTVWGRPVHVQARINNEMMLFTYDGEENHQQRITEELPQPAHVV
jgi:stage V sporulation protein R